MNYRAEEGANKNAPTDTAFSVYRSINLISVIAGIVFGGSMYFGDSHSATVSALSGFALYGGMATLLIVTPHAKEVAIAWMQEVTLRRRDELPYRVGEGLPRVEVVNHPQIAYSEPAQPQPQIAQRRFVPPVPRTSSVVKVDAANFITQLFDTSTGRPIPTKITPKKAQIQHKSPSPEAVEYLLALEIVRRGDGQQLYYNRDIYTGYPLLQDAINAIRSGVRKASAEQGRGEEGRV